MLQRAKYLLFLLSTTSNIFPYIFLTSLMLLVISMGMGAYYFGLFSPDALEAEGIGNAFGGGFFDTLWWSMKHVLDPGALAENYGAPKMVLVFAMFNSMMGLVIVSGLIGFIVNSIQSAVEDARNGAATIREVNHILLLGWNRKAVSVLKQLAKLKETVRVVILTSTNTNVVRAELRQESRKLRGLKILPLRGSIASPSEMTRIAIRKAAYVIVLAEGQGLKNTFSDVTTIKTMMLLNSSRNDGRTSNIVAEIVNTENLPIANIASNMSHPIVSSGQVISKTMVQCARYPGYAQVYSKLFSLEDHKIELKNIENSEGILFGDIATRITNATVIGVSWLKIENGRERRVTVLNPEPDFDLAEDDDLILIKQANEDLEISDYSPLERVKTTETLFNRPNIRKVLILSANPNVGSIIRELDQHSTEQLEIIVACQDANSVCESLGSKYEEIYSSKLKIQPIEFDLDGIWSLEKINPTEFDVIFIVADESESKVDADSRSTLILLLLRNICDKTRGVPFPPVVTEFLDPQTLELVEDSPLTDAVVSTEFLSHLMVQVVRKPFMESIYRELLNAGGIEMGFRSAEAYTELGKPVCHIDIVRQAQRSNEVVLGYKFDDGTKPKIIINPKKDEKYQFVAGDKLIVLAQQLYT